MSFTSHVHQGACLGFFLTQITAIIGSAFSFLSRSQLLKRREVCVPLKIEQLSVELDAWRACTQSNSK